MNKDANAVLLDLAKRVEDAATDDDLFALDREITLATPVLTSTGLVHCHGPHTTNTDAAIALVPDGVLWWRVGSSPKGEAGHIASIAIELALIEVEARVPAQALCAAALRARAYQILNA